MNTPTRRPPYEFKTKPFKHQREYLRRASGRRGFAALMEMGTGKTKAVIDEMGILYSDGLIDCAVVIAPKGVYMNWVRELEIHLGVPFDVVEWRPGGGPKYHQKRLTQITQPSPHKLRVLLLNIEALSSGVRAVRYLKIFMKSGRAFAALDESTKIKNPDSKRTVNTIESCRPAHYRRIMTGSPVTKNPLDVYSQFEFLAPKTLGSGNWFAFRARYALMKKMNIPVPGGNGRTKSINKITGFKNVTELKERVASHSYRVLKEECLDLPPKMYQTRSVAMTDEQAVAYEEMRRYALTLVEGEAVSAKSAITMLIRLHQITCGHVTDENGDVRTLRAHRREDLMDLLDETGDNVIIWSTYRQDTALLADLIRQNYGHESLAQFHGGNVKTREREAQEFVGGDRRFMLSSQSAGGYGNTWVNSATTIYFSNNYDYELRAQSEDRNHRSGQTRSVSYTDLVADGTIDLTILQALKNKMHLASQVTGDQLKEWLI